MSAWAAGMGRPLHRLPVSPLIVCGESSADLQGGEDNKQREIKKMEVQIRMTEEELKANHFWNKVGKMSGLSSGYIKESPWYEGSAVLYGKRPGYHIFMYHLYKYLLYLKKETDFKYKEKKNCSG